jgi:hypothetical protein
MVRRYVSHPLLLAYLHSSDGWDDIIYSLLLSLTTVTGRITSAMALDGSVHVATSHITVMDELISTHLSLLNMIIFRDTCHENFSSN